MAAKTKEEKKAEKQTKQDTPEPRRSLMPVVGAANESALARVLDVQVVRRETLDAAKDAVRGLLGRLLIGLATTVPMTPQTTHTSARKPIGDLPTILPQRPSTIAGIRKAMRAQHIKPCTTSIASSA